MGKTLVVSDLDGTLLRPDKTVGEATVAAVNRYVGAGGLFTYATARSFVTAGPVTGGLDLRLPVITYGGAMRVDPRDGRAGEATMLDPAVVDEILRRTAASEQVRPLLFAMHEGRDRVCWLGGHETPGIGGFLAERPGDHRMLPLDDWDAIDLAAVFYVSLIGPETEVRDLYDDLSGTPAHRMVAEHLYEPHAWWLELCSPEATKAAAVGRLRDEVGADRLVCFGDAVNDLPMFGIADVAVAVGNADPAVRAAATEVIGPNTDESVAAWLDAAGP